MESPLATRLAQTIAADLDQRGISYRDVSDATGIPTTTLHRRLHGHVAFTFTELEGIARLLDTTVTGLIAAADRSAA